MDHARVCQAPPSPSAPLLQPFRWPYCSEASEGAHLLRGALHRNHGACGGHGAFHSFSQLCGLTLAQEEEAGSALALVAEAHGKKRPAPVSPEAPLCSRCFVFLWLSMVIEHLKGMESKKTEVRPRHRTPAKPTCLSLQLQMMTGALCGRAFV